MANRRPLRGAFLIPPPQGAVADWIGPIEAPIEDFSGCELAPLGQGSGPVLVENVAAGEMALVGEVVVDRGLDSGTLLQALDVPDPGHHPVPPSNRWMRVLGSGVKPASAFPPSKTSERLHRSRIRSQPVGDD